MRMSFELPAAGAASLIARSLELLAEVEAADEALMPDAVMEEARQMRAVVDEWVEIVEVVEPEDLQ